MENGTTNYPMPLKNFDTTLLSDDHFLLRGMVYLKENKPDMAQPLKEYLAWKKPIWYMATTTNQGNQIAIMWLTGKLISDRQGKLLI